MGTNKVIIVIIISMTFIGCAPVERNKNIGANEIHGLWYYVSDDSSYREVFYTDSCLWSFDEGGGPRFYRIELMPDDTINLYDQGKLFGKSKVTFPDNEKMILSNDLDTTTFFRINNLLLRNDEMKKLLTGDTEKIQMFIDRYRARRDEWRFEKK